MGVVVSGSRLTGKHTNDISDRMYTLNNSSLPSSIEVAPKELYNKRGIKHHRVVINMGKATQAERQAFIKLWRGRANTDNSERVGARAEKDALARGESAESAKRIGALATIRAERKAIDGFLNKNKKKFKNISVSLK